MPYSRCDATYWKPDFDLIEAMPGGQKLSDWFGFVTSFHDASLVAIDLLGETATLTIDAFRMTSEVDSKGYYVLDRHVTVTLLLTGVSQAVVTSELPTTLLELGVRRVASAGACDLEIGFDDVMGECGSIIATGVQIDFVPAIVQIDGKST
jgi:hypothetical protein